jgi:hypothetical protein
MKLSGRRSQTLEEIQAQSQAVLNTHFQEYFENWQCRWDRRQTSKGDYFDGDAGP